MQPRNKFKIINHPLLEHHLSVLRDANTCYEDFRQTLQIICQLMVYEVTRDLPTRKSKIKTPLEPANVKIVDIDVVVVSIFRAALGMVDAFVPVLPKVRIGHLGFYRNEDTLEPVAYYSKLPQNLEQSVVILCDPMLATGGTLNAALDSLKEQGAQNIKCVSVVAAPEGLESVQKKHPDVQIFAAALDRGLNNKGYILPGLGDAGDRQFGT